MAAGSLPSPGKVVDGQEIGPCVDENCNHIDCAKTREMSGMLCAVCNLPIGYETPFYNVSPEDTTRRVNRLAHAVCWEDRQV